MENKKKPYFFILLFFFSPLFLIHKIIIKGKVFKDMVRNKFLLPMLMKKKTVQNPAQSSVDMDEQAKADGLTSRIPHKRMKRKRNDMDSINGIKKNHCKGINTVAQEAKLVDRISELPESIIHHIFSYLRSAKEAARTSILSKKWRDVWKSLSVLTFDERVFGTDVDHDSDKQSQMFTDFVDNSLQSHLEQNLGIYKLVLRITSKLAKCLDRWVSVALKNGVKELDLHVVGDRLKYFLLLQLTCSTETLIGLRLHGFTLVNFDRLKLKNLQKLYLRRIYVDEQIIQELFSSSPLIMDLRIVECQGLKELKISSSLKLERVELHHCCGLRKIDLQVANLQTFWYCAKKSLRCKINLESCISLKRLTLKDPHMTDNLLHKHLSSFPVLEKLDLSRCNKLKHIVISNRQLRSLILRSCKQLRLVDIETPSICSLEYKSDRMAGMCISLSQWSLNEAKFSFDTAEINEPAILRRNSLLVPFLQEYCSGSKIVVCFSKNIIIFEDCKEIIIPPSPDLKVQVIKSSKDSKDLLDSLLRTWHPETLSIVSSPGSNFPKMVHEIKSVEDPSCCRYNVSNNKCWRHFLEGTEIVNLLEDEVIPLAWHQHVKLFDMKDRITSIQLHWKPYERSHKV